MTDHATALKKALEEPELAAAAAAVAEHVRRGHLTLADVGGFGQNELDGAYAAGVRLLEAGKPAKALQVAGSLILLQPKIAAYRRLAGVACHHLGQLALAEGYYRGAQALDPDDATTMLYRGEALLALGDGAGGAEELRRGVAAAAGKPQLAPLVKRAEDIARAHGLDQAQENA